MLKKFASFFASITLLVASPTFAQGVNGVAPLPPLTPAGVLSVLPAFTGDCTSVGGTVNLSCTKAPQILSGNTTLTVGQTAELIELTGSLTFTTTLPTPVGNAGVNYRILNASTQAQTLTTLAGVFSSASSSGDGAATQSVAPQTVSEIFSDGTSWVINNSGVINSGLSLVGALTPSTTNGIKGTTLGDNANPGSEGEFVCAQVTNGGSMPTGCQNNSNVSTSLTSTVPVNITSMNLTSGDWDVTGTLCVNPGASTTLGVLVGWISTTSATLPGASPLNPSEIASSSQIQPGAGPVCYPLGKIREDISATTTLYLSVYSQFGTSTLSAYGYMSARRAR